MYFSNYCLEGQEIYLFVNWGGMDLVYRWGRWTEEEIGKVGFLTNCGVNCIERI